MIDLRLRAYAPNGPALGLLPDALELQAGLPLGDVSGLTAKYSRRAAGGSLLNRDLVAGLELALEHTTPAGTWVEPRGGRFLLLKRTFDPADQTDTVSLTCPGYMWQLRKARVEKAAGVDLVDGKRAFLTSTAGMILGALINEARARGEINGVTKTFTSALDSAGQAWAHVITIYYEPGLDIWSVLDNLTTQGVCDWSVQGRELQVYNPDTALAVDRTVGADPLSLRLGCDLTAAPSDESIEELTSRAVLRGDNGLLLVEDNPSAPTPWGVWTSTISQGGVSDAGTARTLAQADLARGARVRGQYTRELVLPTTAHDPLVTYAPGDYVMAPGPSRSLERLRVRQITLTKNDAGVTGNVVLHDRVIEAELRRSRRMSGIVGGATSEGGSGARPTPPGDDRRVPQAPAGLVAASDAYIDAAGLARAQVTLTWAPVATATDGTSLDKVSYRVWIRPVVAGEEWRTLLTTSATTVSTSPFEVGSVHELRVQAVNEANARAGALGAVVEVTMEADTTPPPVPSAPILTSSMGTITVTWNGKTSTGTAMPRDFERVEVRQGVAGTPGPVVATLRATSGQDFAVITGAPHGVEHEFAFRAVDRSGNASAWSTSSTATVTPLVDADLIGTTIDEQIAAVDTVATGAQASADGKNTVHYLPAAPAGIAHRAGDTWFNTANANRVSRWSGSAWVLAPLGAGSLLAGSGVNLIPNGAGERGDLYGWPSTLTWDTVDMPAGEAGSFRCAPGAGTATQGGEFFDVQPSTEYLVEVWARADKANSRIYVELRDQAGAHGTTTVAVPGAPSHGSSPYLLGGLVVPTVWTKYSVVAKTSSTATRLRVGGIYFNHSAGTERGAVQALSGVRMRPRAGANLIVDGSITARELAVGTITAESGIIGSLDAGKITVGTIAAARIGVNAITADKILVGPSDDLVPDPFFDSGTGSWSSISAGAGSGFFPEAAMPGRTQGCLLTQRPAGSSNMSLYAPVPGAAQRTPVVAGEQYISWSWVWATGSSSNAQRVDQRVYFYDVAGALIAGTGFGVGGNQTAGAIPGADFTPGVWVRVGGTSVQAPPGAVTMSPRLTVYYDVGSTPNATRWYLGRTSAFRAQSGELIVDGAITARALAVGAVEADKIAANAVTADSIKAGAITGTKIAADAIDGKTITGATVRTAATGARVALTTEALQVFEADNTLVMHYGPLRISGTPDGAGLMIQQPGTGDDIFLARYNGAGDAFVEMGRAGKPLERIVGHAESITLSSATVGGELLLETTQAAAFFRGKTASVQALAGGVEVTAAGGGATVRSSGDVNVQSTSGGAWLQAAGQVQIKSGQKLVFIDHNTTPVGANCYITESGAIYRSTSSRRYKRDVEDLVVDVDQVLAMRPRTWRDRAEAERDPDTTNRYIGFVAEELVDIGLAAFVLYNEAGQVDAIAYDRLTAALVPVLQHQQRQLDEQATTLAALAAKVAALEGAA